MTVGGEWASGGRRVSSARDELLLNITNPRFREFFRIEKIKTAARDNAAAAIPPTTPVRKMDDEVV